MFIKQLLYVLKRPFHFLKTGLLNGLPAEIKYRYPAQHLTIFAITGTDGKTTSSTLLYHVLKTAGKKVGLVSTVAAYVGDQHIDTGFHVTTPSPAQLHQLMRQMVDQGYEYLVLETTSHGLYQFRTWGITPTYAGITNINHEHLDYHVTYDQYVAAKSLIFNKAQVAVINADDHSHSILKKKLHHQPIKVIEYSLSDRLPPPVAKAIKQRFAEKYNHSNARLVVKLAQLIGVTSTDLAKGITSFPGVPGRMQVVPNKLGLNIVIDFAHTPQAVGAALTALRQQLLSPTSRLISVNGCAGLRDVQKRPVMGALAAKLADVAIFTAEDPRTEDVWSIINQMKSHLSPFHSKVMTIVDRKLAIASAVQMAKKGDTIAILGKGHEQSMCFGTTEYPWSDLLAVQEILADKH